MKTYTYQFAVRVGTSDWSMDFLVATEAGTIKAAREMVETMADPYLLQEIIYVRGSRKGTS